MGNLETKEWSLFSEFGMAKYGTTPDEGSDADTELAN
jgi:hypothetical protein